MNAARRLSARFVGVMRLFLVACAIDVLLLSLFR